MKQNKFSKPPLSKEEKEKKIEKFINDSYLPVKENDEVERENTKKEKKIKAIFLRAPETLWEDIHKIMELTGLSMNAVCLELLRPEVKKKLDDLKKG